MDDRFLLYIDILGFTEMTRRKPRKVARLYAILDSLNVHRHSAFKTIVFSDTILVYNPNLAATDDERNYLVWYLIEFAEDLHHRLTGQDIYFRAVLTTGDFSHYPLKNIECFFGEALVNAYLCEKEIPSIGLFIDDRCVRYNKYFPVSAFDDQYHFVYLNRSLETLDKYTAAKYPYAEQSLEDSTPYVPYEVRFLEDVHTMMRTHTVPAVRVKFLTAWDFYARRYPTMVKALAQGSFALTSLTGRRAWTDESAAMTKSIRYFKRIGSGTSLSVKITSGGRKAAKHRQG